MFSGCGPYNFSSARISASFSLMGTLRCVVEPPSLVLV